MPNEPAISPHPKTVEDLRAKLIEANVDLTHIRICDVEAVDDEVFCLTYRDGRWHTFFRERGIARQLESFEREADACSHLLEMVVDKPYLKWRGPPSS